MKHYSKKYRDHLVTGEFFQLKKVKEIPGLLKTYPLPDLKTLDKYYQSEDYLSHSDESKNFFSSIYHKVKNINLRYKYRLISKNLSGKRVLDYGCGIGDFAQYLNKNNLDAWGFEPNEKARKIALEKNPNKIFADNSFLKNQKFEAITLWHVLEHIPKLHKIIALLKDALTPNGTLYVAVPNYKSYDAKFYEEFWAAYDVPRHLWHFDQSSMEQLMSDFGMIIESKYPMYFDAFYVSILSEKYKGSSLGILRAAIIGLLSNLKALKTGEYSSIIYKIKRK